MDATTTQKGHKRLTKFERRLAYQRMWDALSPQQKYLELCRYFALTPEPQPAPPEDYMTRGG